MTETCKYFSPINGARCRLKDGHGNIHDCGPLEGVTVASRDSALTSDPTREALRDAQELAIKALSLACARAEDFGRINGAPASTLTEIEVAERRANDAENAAEAAIVAAFLSRPSEPTDWTPHIAELRTHARDHDWMAVRSDSDRTDHFEAARLFRELATFLSRSETPVEVPTRAQAIAIMGKWPSTSSEVNELVMKLYTQLERAAVLQRAPASTTTTRDWTLHIKWLRDLASPRNWDKDSPERLTVLEVADFLAGVQGTERAPVPQNDATPLTKWLANSQNDIHVERILASQRYIAHCQNGGRDFAEAVGDSPIEAISKAVAIALDKQRAARSEAGPNDR